jgi:acetoin utilization deacetylase AcuC-like enzyme
MKAKTTGIVYDEKMLLHKSKRRHPESPKRLIEIIKTLTQSALLEDPRVDFVDHYDRKATN